MYRQPVVSTSTRNCESMVCISTVGTLTGASIMAAILLLRG